jgi:N-acetylglucosaminyldiphosphoundecaprenol N-acetyl-beta-D-mannosaminyltransferase
MRVDCTDYEAAADEVGAWAAAGHSRYVCVATVNNVMESFDSPAFRRVMNNADLVTPDGMPLVWGLKLLGHSGATRVYGPDLTWITIAKAAAEGIPVGFYGGSPRALELLLVVVGQRFPALRVTYAFSPPFRPLAEEQDRQVVQEINGSGAGILFVGLNSPKQDCWMAAHKGRIQAVMVGVGAAFDFIAGTKPQAPRWMMRCGLEWLFRLATEPRRLWKRYLKHNPRFVALFALQLLGWKKFEPLPTHVHDDC